jgi:hypothetical protein
MRLGGILDSSVLAVICGSLKILNILYGIMKKKFPKRNMIGGVRDWRVI